MIRFLSILFLCAWISGCAGLAPRETPTSSSRAVHQDPQKFEAQARKAFQDLIAAWENQDQARLAALDPLRLIPRADAAGLDGRPKLAWTDEAVYLGKDSIVLRKGWVPAAQEGSSRRQTRVADFTFAIASPLTLIALEGDNPFRKTAEP